jgi:nucleotide-binding universal stress UspA family protein
MPRSTAVKRKEPAGPAAQQSFQDLLVYLDDGAAAQNALAYADSLAVAADGNLSGLMFGFLAAYPASIYMEATPDVWLAAQRNADKEADALEAAIRKQLQSLRSTPELRRARVMGGEAGQILASQARYCDATIIGVEKSGPNDFQRQLFEAALFYSGRPVIVVPEAFKRRGAPQKFLIAWRPGREATRALHDALPLLKGGASDIRLVAIDEGASASQEPEAGADIARHLARHDLKIEVKHIPGGGSSISTLLQNEARYLDADMIVMGGYGHSRLREWMLGGATRDMLAAADIPVLMSH